MAGARQLIGVIGFVGSACLALGSTARADAAPAVLVIADEAPAGSPDAEVIAAVRAALGDIEEVELMPPSPLDLEAVQLALDCTDESAECFGEIAQRMDADVVVVPSLKARRDALELRLAAYRQGQAGLTTAMRKQAGTQLDSTLLDAVPGMVREALQLAEEPEEARPVAKPEAEALEPLAEEPPGAPPAAVESGASIPLGPVLLGGAGAALLATGVVAGIMAASTEEDYASLNVASAADAQEADDLRVQGKNEATAANILMGTGLAALVGAGIWYVLDDGGERAPQRASLVPFLGADRAGLVLTQAWSSP